MKILSVAWNVYEKCNNEYRVLKNGGSIMIADICEFIGKKEESYLYVGNIAVHEDVQIGDIKLLKNTSYLPEVRNEETIDEWQEGLIKELNEIIDYLKPDMVFVQGGGEFTYNALNLCMKKKQKSAFVCHLYIGDKRKIIEGYKDNVWEKRVLSIPDLQIITVGNAMKSRINRELKIESRNIHVIVNGTKIKNDKNNYLEDIRLRKDNKKILLCSGSLQARKNQIQIVKALQYVRKDVLENISIIFVGKALKNDVYRNRIEDEIRKNNYEDIVRIIGAIESEEMNKVYSETDGLIMTALAEGVSLVALEAITFGKPVIMFSDNETAADVNDEQAVILIKDHSDESVARAIEQWYEKEWDYKHIIDYSKKFKMERVADEYITYINNKGIKK
ncbi:glycosyltransferase family 4 protein [Pseudobutyrivibrio ruminis]|uniref:glycosyltransferase family 4 protein n=1 Tax=Pseudobutyrivibrio ruminis TaxID=46206 RepID=UPI000410412A|nr:glycosyltransferase family 4 protein [Pseudobutyrivibrio ruminis]